VAAKRPGEGRRQIGKVCSCPLHVCFCSYRVKMAVIPDGWPSAGDRTGGTVRPLARTGDELGPSVPALVLNR